MKRIFKTICGICTATVMGFSLVACSPKNETKTSDCSDTVTITKSTTEMESSTVGTLTLVSETTTTKVSTTFTRTTTTTAETTTTEKSKTETFAQAVTLLQTKTEAFIAQEMKATALPIETTTTSTTTSTTTTAKETIETKAETTTVPVETSILIVYKPNTHYVHKSNCHWVDDSCYEITDTNEIEARKCTECDPDITIVTEYVQPSVNAGISYDNLSEWDITLLRKIVSNEWGSDWVSVEDKAKIVASVMNMVKDPRWGNTIESVLDVSCAPWGFNKYANHYMSDSIIAAVDYYFANKDTVFANWTCNSWYGDGVNNYFYTA